MDEILGLKKQARLRACADRSMMWLAVKFFWNAIASASDCCEGSAMLVLLIVKDAGLYSGLDLLLAA